MCFAPKARSFFDFELMLRSVPVLSASLVDLTIQFQPRFSNSIQFRANSFQFGANFGGNFRAECLAQTARNDHDRCRDC